MVATPIQLSGRRLHVVSAFETSPERKRVEAEFRESQAVLLSIADNIAEAIYRSDAAHRLIFVNQAYLRLFRYESLAELQWVPREKLYMRAADRQRLLGLLTAEGAFDQQEVEYVRKDGTRFWGRSRPTTGSRNPETGAIAYHVGRSLTYGTPPSGRSSPSSQRDSGTAHCRKNRRTFSQRGAHAHPRGTRAKPLSFTTATTAVSSRATKTPLACFGRSREELCTLTPLDLSPSMDPNGVPSAEIAAERIRETLAGGDAGVRVDPSPRQRPGNPLRSAPGSTCRRRAVASYAEASRTPPDGFNTSAPNGNFQISEAVHTAGDLDHLYERIHRIIEGLMPASNFYLALLHPDEPSRLFPYYRDEFSKTPAPRQIDTGLTGAVIRSGQPLLVDEALMARKRRVGDGPEVTFEGLEHLRHVESEDEAADLGGCAFEGGGSRSRRDGRSAPRDPRAYGESEKQVLTYVASQIAMAIQRKRSEQALRDSEQKFRALFRSH